MKLTINNVDSSITLSPEEKTALPTFYSSLRERTKLRPKGYGMTPMYKSGRWDGYRFFVGATGKFQTGLLPTIYPMIEEHAGDIPIVIEDKRTNKPIWKPEFVSCLMRNDGTIFNLKPASTSNVLITAPCISVHWNF